MTMQGIPRHVPAKRTSGRQTQALPVTQESCT
jgi:hypothetical protein